MLPCLSLWVSDVIFEMRHHKKVVLKVPETTVLFHENWVDSPVHLTCRSMASSFPEADSLAKLWVPDRVSQIKLGRNLHQNWWPYWGFGF